MGTPPLKRILLAEDEPDIQAVAGLSLRVVGGFEVEICAGGPAFLERFAAFSPDLVVLDVMMPGMSGPEVLARLRTLPGGSSVPVVFMTAKVQWGEVDDLVALGAAGVVPKPFDPMTLPSQLQAFWERVHPPDGP